MSGRQSYARPMTRTWWLKRPGYRHYMLREATSVFVLLFSLELYFALFSLVKGEHAWNTFILVVQSPFAVMLNLVIFSAVIWHLATWFALTPQTMPVKIQDKAVAPKFIVLGHYAALVVISVMVLLVLGGVL